MLELLLADPARAFEVLHARGVLRAHDLVVEPERVLRGRGQAGRFNVLVLVSPTADDVVEARLGEQRLAVGDHTVIGVRGRRQIRGVGLEVFSLRLRRRDGLAGRRLGVGVVRCRIAWRPRDRLALRAQGLFRPLLLQLGDVVLHALAEIGRRLGAIRHRALTR